MNQLDFMIKKREMELKIESMRLKELKRNQRKLKVLERKLYPVAPVEILVSWFGSFMDWITNLVKKDNKFEE